MSVNRLERNIGEPRPLPTRMKTLKVDIRVWDSLKSLKKENETFNDVIKELLNERTKSINSEGIGIIAYKRKTTFFQLQYPDLMRGFEFEYNDIKKNKLDFTLDLKIKKVFPVPKIFSASQFFGVDNTHKHYSDSFLLIYLKAVAFALKKEFRAHFIPSYIEKDEGYKNSSRWRKLYYDYNLSEESFKSDIEEPLRLSVEEKPSKVWKDKVDKSPANLFMKKHGAVFR